MRERPERKREGEKEELPRWPLTLLRAWADPALLEDIEGDLEELFRRRVERRGLWAARLHYAFDALRFIRPYTQNKKPPAIAFVGFDMIKNYLLLAFRHLRKQPGYGFINVFGLAVGMACCLLILLLVRHEWSFDRFHENGDRIHRVMIREVSPEGAEDYRELMPPTLGPAMQAAFPRLDHAVRVIGGTLNVRHGTDLFTEPVYLADSTFFQLFTFPFLAGNPATALDDPQSVVITQEMAHKYFGNVPAQDVLGRSLTVEQGSRRLEATVTGVTTSIPTTSSLQFNLVFPFNQYQRTFFIGANDWGGRASLYVLLPEGETPASFEQALPSFTATEFAERIQLRHECGFITAGAAAFRLVLQPLEKMHLQPDWDVQYEAQPHDPTYSYILGGIALLVLLIACINFVTLSLGRSTSRAREVGMRKVLGAARGQVVRQFWGESLLLSGISFLLGLLLARLALPWFNELTQQNLGFTFFSDAGSLLALLGLIVLVGLLAGGYPAFVLSRFQPATVLKGSLRGGNKSRFTRASSSSSTRLPWRSSSARS